jgi:hypothetical protein
MSNAHELAKVYYAAARAEILQRLALREQVLLAGVAAFGVIAGLALNNNMANLRIVGLFPLLSLAFSVVLFRHHFLLKSIGEYIGTALDPSLAGGNADGLDAKPMPLHWDAWLSMPGYRHLRSTKVTLRTILAAELLGEWLMLWLPGLSGLIIVFHSTPHFVIWIDIALLILAIAPYVIELRGLAFLWKPRSSKRNGRESQTRNH